jgi:hypothetical protein
MWKDLSKKKPAASEFTLIALPSDKRNHTWRNSEERKVYLYHRRKYLALILVNKDYALATSEEV